MDVVHHAAREAKRGPVANSGRRLGYIAVLATVAGGFIAGSLTLAPEAEAQRAGAAQEVLTPLGRAPLSFADIVERVKPAVVSVSVVNDGSKDEDKDSKNVVPGIPEDSPFYDLFKNLPKEFRNRPQQRIPRRGQGSGFVISSDGYVVTNNHVVDGATKIQVSFGDLEKIDAELIGTDVRTDLALLKLKSDTAFPVVRFSKKKPRVGDWALAIGNPFGLGGTVTAGIVSALSRDINEGPYDYMQIDAAVNKGNSGGPTFNLDGEVIGVNTAIFSPSGGSVGIAFAVPAARVEKVIEELKNNGSIARGWLGVQIRDVDPDTAASLRLKKAKGAMVSEVSPKGPAESAGFKVYDVILKVNDASIDDSRDLARKIADYSPDTSVAVKVWRDNSEQLINVKLGKFPNTAAEIAKLKRGEGPTLTTKKTKLKDLGLTLMPAGSGAKIDGVAIAEVDPKSDAANKGVRAGDVILQVDRQLVSTADEVAAKIKSVKDRGLEAVMLVIQSGNRKNFLPLRFSKG